MQIEDIKKLAELARLEIEDSEAESLAKDFDTILAYVGQIQEAVKEVPQAEFVQENIVREDIVTNNSETAEAIIKEMPDTQDGYLKVHQIL